LSLTIKYIVITVQGNYGRELRISFEIRKKRKACEIREVCEENEGNA